MTDQTASKCPFCGTGFRHLFDGDGEFLAACCGSCGSLGPYVRDVADKKAALFAWNNRALQPTSADTKDGWISVDDRLPESNVEVLCAGQGWADPFVTACYYDEEREGWWTMGSHWTDAADGQVYPIHWRPLPEAPGTYAKATGDGE